MLELISLYPIWMKNVKISVLWIFDFIFNFSSYFRNFKWIFKKYNGIKLNVIQSYFHLNFQQNGLIFNISEKRMLQGFL